MAEDSKMINGHPHRKLHAVHLSEEDSLSRAEAFYQMLDSRRSIREFSSRKVSKHIIENIIKSAGTAPSGAHKQPWKFCVVSSSEIKQKIRAAAEKEETENYENRMSDRWLKDLEPFGTDSVKEFIETAPWIIVVFKQAYGLDENDEKTTNYYVNESVGIACGMLISAIHNAGLYTLTHTPSPMNFLEKILNRPKNERAYLLLPVGYPADEVYVPDIERKSLADISEFYE